MSLDSGSATYTGSYSSSTSTLTVSLPPYGVTLPAYSVYRPTVYVFNQNENVGTSRTAFTYTWKPSIVSISPLTGSLSGGTEIIIRGKYFIDTGLFKCYVGNYEFTAAFVSVNRVTCTTKAVTGESSGIIAVNFDGFSNLTFTNSTGDIQRF